MNKKKRKLNILNWKLKNNIINVILNLFIIQLN